MHEIVRHVSLVLAFAASVAATAADRIAHPYRDVCEQFGLSRFHAIPESQRDHLRVLFKVSEQVPALPVMVLTINSKAHAIVVAPDSNGILDFPYDEQLLAENPDVLINLPAQAKFSLALDFRPRVPNERQMSYMQLMGAIPQANALIRKEAGLLRLFAPTMHGVVLAFDHAQGQQVTIGEGATQRQMRVDSSGKIIVSYEEALAAANPRVVLSAIPQSIDFAD